MEELEQPPQSTANIVPAGGDSMNNSRPESEVIDSLPPSADTELVADIKVADENVSGNVAESDDNDDKYSNRSFPSNVAVLDEAETSQSAFNDDASSDDDKLASDNDSEDSQEEDLRRATIEAVKSPAPPPPSTAARLSALTSSWMKPLWGSKPTASAAANKSAAVAAPAPPPPPFFKPPTPPIPSSATENQQHEGTAPTASTATTAAATTITTTKAPASRSNSITQWSEGVNKSISSGLKDFSSVMSQFAAAVEETFIPDETTHPSKERPPGESADIFNASITEVLADLGKDLATGLSKLTHHSSSSSTTTTATATAIAGAGKKSRATPSPTTGFVNEADQLAVDMGLGDKLLEFHAQVGESYDDEFNKVESVDTVTHPATAATATTATAATGNNNDNNNYNSSNDLSFEDEAGEGSSSVENDTNKEGANNPTAVAEEDCYI